MIKYLLGVTGLDRSVATALTTKVWSTASGLVTIYFVTRFLSAEEQGYFYTFYSLIALQIFVELGLNFAIVQFVSHEMAGLHWLAEGIVAGDSVAKRRLQSVLMFGLTWFGCAACLVIVVLVPAGVIFFNIAVTEAAQFPIAAPWALVVVFTAFGLLLNALLAVLEGCGKVADVALIRLLQAIVSGLGLWAVLFSGGGLWALAVGGGLSVLSGGVAVVAFYRVFFRDLLHARSTLPGVDWKAEIWPFQWRIAVSWASGYLIFNLFTPLLFASHGSVAAGRMGLSLQIIAAMNDVAMVWVTTKMPLFGKLIATGERSRLISLFTRALGQSFVVLLLGIGTVVSILFYMTAVAPDYASRALPLFYFSGLCVVCLSNHLVFAEAALLRAHKEEPFMALSLANATVTAIASVALIPSYGLLGAVLAYAIGNVFIGLIGGSVVFYRRLGRLGIPAGLNSMAERNS